jgi:hypothetical protein
MRFPNTQQVIIPRAIFATTVFRSHFLSRKAIKMGGERSSSSPSSRKEVLSAGLLLLLGGWSEGEGTSKVRSLASVFDAVELLP